MTSDNSESGIGFYQDLASRATSTAMSWFSPVASWLGGWVSSNQPLRRRSEASQVAGSLVLEVINQGRILEEQQARRRQEEKLATRSVDYSWLVTEKRPLYNLSDVEKLELERLCQQVAPESYSRVIREFRSALLREPPIADLPLIMRAIVSRVIDEQQNARESDSVVGLPRWLSQSLTSLRSRFSDTMPLMASSNQMELKSCVVSSMELGSLGDSDL